MQRSNLNALRALLDARSASGKETVEFIAVQSDGQTDRYAKGVFITTGRDESGDTIQLVVCNLTVEELASVIMLVTYTGISLGIFDEPIGAADLDKSGIIQ